MIKKIQFLKDFGVYNDFEWKSLPHFREKNIFYGWNYSGKTTLSRLFACLRDKALNSNFEQGRFKIIADNGQEITESNLANCNLKIQVYNSDYIRDNLRWDRDNKINGISFDVGENVQLRERISENNKLISRINGDEHNRGKKEPFLVDYHNYLPYEESKFSIGAKRIKNDIFNSLIDFDKRHFVKIKDEVISDLNASVLNEENLLYHKKMAVMLTTKETISPVNFDFSIEDTISDVIAVLKEELFTIEAIHFEDATVASWIKEGFHLHEQTDKCLFCDSQFSANRRQVLQQYLSGTASTLREKIANVLIQVQDLIQKIESLKLPRSKNDFFETHQDSYEKQLAIFNTNRRELKVYLESLISQLRDKEINHLFNKLEIASVSTKTLDDFKNIIVDINSIIENNNYIIENFIETKNLSRDLLRKHYVAQYLIQEQYIEKRKRKEFAMRCLERYDSLVRKLQDQNSEYESQLKSITAGRKELNNFINNFLNRKDLVIEVIEQEKFILKRGDKIAENFSEGEKTAISFSYFLVQLESLMREGKLIDYIIFIDDPISSLDSNHISQIYSILNSFFFRKGVDGQPKDKIVDCFRQLFISTHNSDFFAFLKDSNRINKKVKVGEGNQPTSEYFLIKKISDTVSDIRTLPRALKNHKSEYLYLFELILGFHLSENKEHDERIILLPNAIRRFLEIYTLMKLPSSTDEVDNRLKLLFPEFLELKTLHHFSHFTNLEKVTKHDNLIMNLPQAVNELMNLLQKDEKHFESLKAGCNPN